MKTTLVITIALVLGVAVALPPSVDELVPESDFVETVSDLPQLKHQWGVYARTVVKMGKRGFRRFMNTNICPIAAAQMKTLYACPNEKGRFGQCVEYQHFRNQAEMDKYRAGAFWRPYGKLLADFFKSGSSSDGGPHKISKMEFDQGIRNHRCKKIKAKDLDASDDVYARTVVTFGQAGFNKYMYRNLCPIAAAHMKNCFACPNSKGKFGQCVEYQHFANKNEYKAYKRGAFWYKQPAFTHVKKFFASGTITDGGPHIISKAEFDNGRKGCKRINAKP